VRDDGGHVTVHGPAGLRKLLIATDVIACIPVLTIQRISFVGAELLDRRQHLLCLRARSRIDDEDPVLADLHDDVSSRRRRSCARCLARARSSRHPP
jgi:hypothetical protein